MSKIEENALNIATIAAQLSFSAGNERILIAIAGAPGSGKSTLAERVVALINDVGAHKASLFPMDGYHYDDVVLETIGRRAFKGAIDTYDAHGLRHMLERLKANADDIVAIPVFDRSIEIARAGGNLIPKTTDIVVCEGNYLLSTQPPWDRLKSIFDFTVFVDVSVDELRNRLRQRWLGYGLDPDDVDRKVEENDLPNGLSIISESTEPNLRVENT